MQEKEKKKINFYSLVKKWRKPVLIRFFTSLSLVLLRKYFFGNFEKYFPQIVNSINGDNSDKEDLPWLLKAISGSYLSEEGKINLNVVYKTLLSLITFFVFYSFLSLLDSFLEEKVKIKTNSWLKKTLLTKFRNLTLENQQEKKVTLLLEHDAWEIGENWEHLYNHLIFNVLEIILVIHTFSEKKITLKAKLITTFLVFLYVLVNYLILNHREKLELIYKEKSEEEDASFRKETNNIILIESMGLENDFSIKQKEKIENLENATQNIVNLQIFSRSIVGIFFKYGIRILIAILLFKSPLVIIDLIWAIEVFIRNLRDLISCLWDYPRYSNSLKRVNEFLALEEKNENILDGKILSLEKNIKEIEFKGLSFRYKGQQKWLIKSHNQIFVNDDLNFLKGKNGVGKTTMLYLILGLIKPQEGKIFIKDEEGKTYNLHEQINLKTWREKNVAFCSYQNIEEEGSAGQKQLTNLKNVLKKEAQIFLFDEADNSLDERNKEFFEKEIEKIIKKGKLVIVVKH